jgi:hypothetical protein
MTLDPRANSRSVGEDHGLHAGDFKALAAAHVFAGQLIVFAQHIRSGFGKACAVALIGASCKLALFGAHQPVDFVLAGLLAMRAVQRGLFPFLFFVEKVAFFHEPSSVAWSLAGSLGTANPTVHLIIKP